MQAKMKIIGKIMYCIHLWIRIRNSHQNKVCKVKSYMSFNSNIIAIPIWRWMQDTNHHVGLYLSWNASYAEFEVLQFRSSWISITYGVSIKFPQVTSHISHNPFVNAFNDKLTSCQCWSPNPAWTINIKYLRCVFTRMSFHVWVQHGAPKIFKRLSILFSLHCHVEKLLTV